MASWDQISRDELMQRAARDNGVNLAMATHKDSLGDTDRRMVQEVAHLAAHTALTQYAAQIKMEIARIESFERMRRDEISRRPMPPIMVSR